MYGIKNEAISKDDGCINCPMWVSHARVVLRRPMHAAQTTSSCALSPSNEKDRYMTQGCLEHLASEVWEVSHGTPHACLHDCSGWYGFKEGKASKETGCAACEA